MPKLANWSLKKWKNWKQKWKQKQPKPSQPKQQLRLQPKVPKQPKGVASVVKPPPPDRDPPPPPPVPKDEPIPEGTGKLVISVGDNTARSLIFVQGEEWGAPPMNRKVASGMYKVMVKLENGSQASFKAAVMPDKTTVLTLEPGSLRWSSRNQ